MFSRLTTPAAIADTAGRMVQHPHKKAATQTSHGKSRFLKIIHRTGGIRLSLVQGYARHLGLDLRKAEAQRRIMCILKRAEVRGDFDDTGQCLTVHLNGGIALPGLLHELDAELARITSRPLTPRLVQGVLGITAQERLRWTKDGRLPSHGSASFRRGQRITISTYAVAAIERLLADPSLIAAWREQDRVALI